MEKLHFFYGINIYLMSLLLCCVSDSVFSIQVKLLFLSRSLFIIVLRAVLLCPNELKHVKPYDVRLWMCVNVREYFATDCRHSAVTT